MKIDLEFLVKCLNPGYFGLLILEILRINVSLSFGWIQYLQNYLNRLIGKQHKTLENHDQEAYMILLFRKQKPECRIWIKLIDNYRWATRITNLRNAA